MENVSLPDYHTAVRLLNLLLFSDNLFVLILYICNIFYFFYISFYSSLIYSPFSFYPSKESKLISFSFSSTCLSRLATNSSATWSSSLSGADCPSKSLFLSFRLAVRTTAKSRMSLPSRLSEILAAAAKEREIAHDGAFALKKVVKAQRQHGTDDQQRPPERRPQER